MGRFLRWIAWSILAIAAVGAAGFAVGIAALPPAPTAKAIAPIMDEEARETVEALKPFKRPRPVVAIIGISDMTEVTDYLMPYGILKLADVADVVALSTQPGPMKLYPALQVQPQATIADFDVRYPDGADYVIVPAMDPEDDPAALGWIRAQANRGAFVIGVCVGAKVFAGTGLLDGRRATTHWYSLERMLKAHPTIRPVSDRRFVVDGRFATTTGISASMPMSLTLVEAIAGRDRAQAVAAEFGVAHWDARHDSSAFKFTRPFAVTAIVNALTFWRRESLGIELVTGIDEVSLALVADAWSRTYRSHAVTYATNADVIESKGGLHLIPDSNASEAPHTRLSTATLRLKAAEALDKTLDEIGSRYHAETADFVAVQLEYQRRSKP